MKKNVPEQFFLKIDQLAENRDRKGLFIALETQVNLELNKQRLVLANKLLSRLKDEKLRQREEVLRMAEDCKFLVGNCIIAAGMMNYSGTFDST